MIGWEDVYKVVAAMVPLYFALFLGYGSVKWWGIFTPEQCDAINSLICYFILPLFTAQFNSHINPFQMNFKFIGADVISKLLVVVVLAFWAKCSAKGSFCWSITSYSLSSLNNTLIVGVPLLKAMYGETGVDLVVQSSVVQSIVWMTILLFVLEFQRSRGEVSVSFSATTTDVELQEKDVEGNIIEAGVISSRPSFLCLMKVVGMKLARNPNVYACVIGLVWAFVASRWHFGMPSIIEGSIMIMSKAGIGTSMFSMGTFMARQEKILACGKSLTIYGIVLRFIAGPAAMAIGAIAVGLHGQVLRMAIIQAALPQAVSSFVFAKEYGVHAEVLSTAVIFGTVVSLPVLIAYYAVLEFVH